MVRSSASASCQAHIKKRPVSFLEAGLSCHLKPQ
jgi:hypothetical protein